MDWKEHFEKISRFSPVTNNMEIGLSTNFWEDLYQAFKERMLEEIEQDIDASVYEVISLDGTDK